MKEWITGRNPVYECLRANRRHFFNLWVLKGADHKGVLGDALGLARQHHVPIRLVEKQQLAAITSNHQGVALQVNGFSYRNLDAIINFSQQAKQPLFVLLLDHIQDPQNLGTLIRAAEVFGVHGIVLPGRRAAGITPAVVNASSGAAEHLIIAQMNIAQAIDALKDAGVWVVGLDMDKSAQELADIDLSGPLAVIVGGEGSGLGRLVKEKCDHVAYIPMHGRTASLNAATAGAIALYEASRTRE